VADAILKDVMQEMEHPFYSLSKKPDITIQRYEHNGNWLEITPSVKGLATIYDKDLLIYAISQLIAKMNQGESVGKRVRINSYDFLKFTNRGTGGKDYVALVSSLERLRGTTISTNIRTGDEEQIDTFGLIEKSSVRRKFGNDGRLLWVELTLSDWVFNAIRNQEVLTLHPSYFRLRKPMERRIYELARKHCGMQPSWKCGIGILLKKSGSKSPLKHFKYLLKEIAEKDHLPDYSLEIVDEFVVFTNRGSVSEPIVEMFDGPLPAGAYENARDAAPGWDPRYIEGEWRKWCGSEEIEPKNPERHFLKFCRTWYEKRGDPV
jgi:plasmid replication initiation protein